MSEKIRQKSKQNNKANLKFISSFYPSEWLNILLRTHSQTKCLLLLKKYFPIATTNVNNIINLANKSKVDFRILGIEKLQSQIPNKIRFYFLDLLQYNYSEDLDDFIKYFLKTHYQTELGKKLIPNILQYLLPKCSLVMLKFLKVFLKKIESELTIEIYDINLLRHSNIEIFNYIANGIGKLKNEKFICDKDMGFRKKLPLFSILNIITNLTELFNKKEKIHYETVLDFLFDYLMKNPELEKRIFNTSFEEVLNNLIKITTLEGNTKNIDYLCTKFPLNRFTSLNKQNLLHLAKVSPMKLKEKFLTEKGISLLELSLQELEELFKILQMNIKFDKIEDEVDKTETYLDVDIDDIDDIDDIIDELSDFSEEISYTENLDNSSKLLDTAISEEEDDEEERDLIDFDVLLSTEESMLITIDNISNETSSSLEEIKMNIPNNIDDKEFDFILENTHINTTIDEKLKMNYFKQNKRTIFHFLAPNNEDKKINTKMIRLTDQITNKYFSKDNKFVNYFVNLLDTSLYSPNFKISDKYFEFLLIRIICTLQKTFRKDIEMLLVKFPKKLQKEILKFFTFNEDILTHFSYENLIEFLCTKMDYYNEIKRKHIVSSDKVNSIRNSKSESTKTSPSIDQLIFKIDQFKEDNKFQRTSSRKSLLKSFKKSKKEDSIEKVKISSSSSKRRNSIAESREEKSQSRRDNNISIDKKKISDDELSLQYKENVDQLIMQLYVKFFYIINIKDFYVSINETSLTKYDLSSVQLSLTNNLFAEKETNCKTNIETFLIHYRQKLMINITKLGDYKLYNYFCEQCLPLEDKNNYIFFNKDIKIIKKFLNDIKITDERREQIQKELVKYSDIITYQFKEKRIDILEIIRNKFEEDKSVNYTLIKYLITDYDIKFTEQDIFHFLYLPSKFSNSEKISSFKKVSSSEKISNDEKRYIIENNSILFELFLKNLDKIIVGENDKNSFAVLLKVSFRLRNNNFILHLMNNYSDEFRENMSNEYFYYICDINIAKKLHKECIVILDEMLMYQYLPNILIKILVSDKYYEAAEQRDVIMFLEYVLFNYCSTTFKDIINMFLSKINHVSCDKVIDYLLYISN